MPVTVSYPGVYVQEIPSGQQTIGGVATSITAFVGRTYRGPVNQATSIFSFADFQRVFGGVSNGYPLSFAVRDFFQNGGSQGIVVRVFGPEWLDYPVASEQQLNAEAAVEAVMAQLGTPPLPQDSQTVATEAASVAASYYGGEYPEQYQAANYMATQASNWATAVAPVQVSTLVTSLSEVTTVMQSAANAVLAAMQNPESYDLSQSAISSPPYPDPTSVVEVAQEAAAAQIPGAAQQAAMLVYAAVQNEYDVDVNADYDSLVAAATTAVGDVGVGIQALEEAVTSVPPSTADEFVQGLMNTTVATLPIYKQAKNAETATGTALAGTNSILSEVLPAFQLAAPLEVATDSPPAEVYLTQLSAGPQPSLAVQAALPASTASIQLAAPLNFAAVAEAANSVAEAAWITALDQLNSGNSTTQQGMNTSQAASETAAYVKTNNPALPAASQAASAVATAVSAKLLQGGVAAATAGSAAVASAVATALQLSSSNGAVVALLSAEQVATAAWTNASETTPDPNAVTNAVNAAPSRSAAQATAAVYTANSGGTPRNAAIKTSEGLVSAAIGALPMLTLNAANPGEWPNGSLTVTLNTNGITQSVVSAMGLTPAPGNPPFSPGDLFNLNVGYTAPDGSTMSETWNTVSLRSDAGGLRIDRVLANSNLIQYLWPGYTAGSTYPTTSPPPVPVSGAYGVAGVAAVPAAGTYGVAGVLPTYTPSGPLQGTASLPLQMEDLLGSQTQHTGIYALDHVDQFDLLCIPPDVQIETLPPAIPPVNSAYDQWRMELYQTAAVYCQSKYAMLIIDPPDQWAADAAAGNTTKISINDLGTYGPEGEYAAVYFPYLVEGNPLLNGQLGYFAPSGAIAGICARTDAARGVWKAPAGINDGALSGTQGLELRLSDNDSGLLNPQGINCLRTFPVYGNVVWGARTLKGADVLNNDYKYVPVRRLALYIEASLLRGLQYAVFEPNADPLWSSIRSTVTSFMNTLFRQGAFAGATAKDAFYVACDSTTTTPDDIAQGIVNVSIGFAPLLPAEFVVITIQQIAGQTPT
jgi:phage tail sheath protein FI